MEIPKEIMEVIERTYNDVMNRSIEIDNAVKYLVGFEKMSEAVSEFVEMLAEQERLTYISNWVNIYVDLYGYTHRVLTFIEKDNPAKIDEIDKIYENFVGAVGLLRSELQALRLTLNLIETLNS